MVLTSILPLDLPSAFLRKVFRVHVPLSRYGEAFGRPYELFVSKPCQVLNLSETHAVPWFLCPTVSTLVQTW